MSGRALISGSGLSIIDPKGRVAIPSDLRNAIVTNNLPQPGDEGRRFFLGRNPNSHGLIGFDKARLSAINETIQGAESARFAASGDLLDFETRGRYFPATEPTPFDGSGRFIMTPRMKAKGGLDDLAYFYGLGDFFVICNPRTTLADPNAREDLKDDIRWELNEKGLA